LPGTKRLKLIHDKQHSSIAFHFELRRYTLELDNSIRVSLGRRAGAGAELAVNRGNVTDAESLLRWHQIVPGNPDNGVRLQLPGAEVEAGAYTRPLFGST